VSDLLLEGGGSFLLEGGGSLLLEGAAVILGTEINVGGSFATNQYQQTMSINPNNADEILITVKTDVNEGNPYLFYTGDGGATWAETALTVGDGDPYVTHDNLGNAYVSAIGPSGYDIQITSNGGATLSSVITVGGPADHPCSICDNTPASPYYGNYYLAGRNSGILILSTPDQGATWSQVTFQDTTAPSGQSTNISAGGFVEGPCVLPDGTVLFPVVNGNTFSSPNALQEAYVLRSTDGGSTWSVIDLGLMLRATSSAYVGGIGVNGMSNITWSNLPGGGYRLYVVTSITYSTANADMILWTSDDGGATWTSATTIFSPGSSDPGTSPMSIMVNPAGVVGIGFYGCLGSAYTYPAFGTFFTSAVGRHFAPYFLYSKDQGATWSVPIQVSSVVSDTIDVFSTGGPRPVGEDHTKSAASPNGDFVITWQDSRSAASTYTTYMRTVTVL
jgi:photosystem II stability/assembly factor-like uncharacterized protein